jgi:hypothetical protein
MANGKTMLVRAEAAFLKPDGLLPCALDQCNGHFMTIPKGQHSGYFQTFGVAF